MKKLFFLSLLLLTSYSLSSQEETRLVDALPENPGNGKCYAKCIEPDEYTDEIIRIMTKPSYKVLEVVPAEYKMETQTVVVKPASKKFIYVPATYKTVVDTVYFEEGYNKISIEPASFRNGRKNIEIKSEVGKWVAGEKDPDCPSIDPDDCRIFHYKVTPAVQRAYPVKELVKNDQKKSSPIRGKYQLVKRQVEVSAASYKEEMIPEVTKSIERKILVKDESTRETTIPAEYSEVTKTVLVKAGGMSVWREVPCTLPKEELVLPINWNLASYELTPQAKSIIDKRLLSVARKRKNSIIEVGSHTDSRGTEIANQVLSENRAKAVVEYLISKGIKKSRLLAVGYGESKPKNECADGVECGESKHAINRRTEFKIY